MPKDLKCKCPECGHEFIRPPFNPTEYSREQMRKRRAKKKAEKSKEDF